MRRRHLLPMRQVRLGDLGNQNPTEIRLSQWSIADFGLLIARANYDFESEEVTKERFPVRSPLPVSRTLVLLRSREGIKTAKILEEAKQKGLQRPTHEDCLRLGADAWGRRLKFPGSLVFLHEPVDIDGVPSFLSLDPADDQQLDLCDNRIVEEGLAEDCVFVFARP